MKETIYFIAGTFQLMKTYLLRPLWYFLGGWSVFILSIIGEEVVRALLTHAGSDLIWGEHWWFLSISIYIPCVLVSVSTLLYGALTLARQVLPQHIPMRTLLISLWMLGNVCAVGIGFLLLTLYSALWIGWGILGVYDLP
jgi:hypothetical protein